MIFDKKKKSPLENFPIRQALPQILAVCVKNTLLLAFGMALGFPTILIPNFSGNYPQEKISMGQEAISWIGSINLICVPVGCLLSGCITQYLGRRKAMQIVNIPFVMAWLLFHYSTQDWEIFLALAVTGLAGGLLEAPVLTYVAEVTQPQLRGILSSTSTMSVSLGILCEFLLGTFLPWRSLVLVNCTIPILSIVLLNFVPETPVWLLSKQRDVEAQQSIAWLRGWTTVENVELEFQELQKQLKHNEVSKQSDKLQALKLLGKKNFIWPYMVVSFAFLLGSFNGTQTLQTYAIKIFVVTRAPIDKYYATILVGVVQLLGCTFCAILINIIGKRILNFISVLGAGICFFITATYIYYIDVRYFEEFKPETSIDRPEDFHWIPVFFLVLSSFFSYIGLKMLPWILIGEVYSNEVRSTAAGISGGTGYIFGFLANKIFLSMVTYITLPGVFWLSSLVGILGTVILYFILPETEGKSLYEITEHFAGRSKLSHSVSRRTKQTMAGNSNAAFETDESKL